MMPRARVGTFGLILTLIAAFLGPPQICSARAGDDTLARIIAIADQDNRAMTHLTELTVEIGARPADTYEALEAYRWAQNRLAAFGLQNVHLEKCGEIDAFFPSEYKSEQYERLYRSMFDDEPNLDRIPIFNVVADIEGTTKADEYVILGGHLDSTPHGAGATDNGTGVAAVMEAARILAAAEAAPLRTIRFILFGAEEIGLVGSNSYVADHPDLLPKISAVYVMDFGADYLSGISATEPLKADITTAFAAAAGLDPDMPFAVEDVVYLPAHDPNCASAMRTVSVAAGETRVIESGSCGTARGVAEARNPESACGSTSTTAIKPPGCIPQAAKSADDDRTESACGTVPGAISQGSTDHAPFLVAGVPAFFLKQQGTPSLQYPAHTSGDTADKVVPQFLRHSAAVLALGAYGTANLDNMLSREKLADPAAVAASSEESTQDEMSGDPGSIENSPKSTPCKGSSGCGTGPGCLPTRRTQ